MLISKWSPPEGGTGLGGNTAETLLPVTYITMRRGGGGGRGKQSWGAPICKK